MKTVMLLAIVICIASNGLHGADRDLYDDRTLQTGILFSEDFESSPLNQPYPWNGSNNDEWYPTAYNRAVPVSDFQEHDRDFLGDKILYINAGESYHLIPSQNLPVQFDYDLLFHYSEQSPSGFGAIFGQSIIVNIPGPRGGIIGLNIQKGFSYSYTQQDGIYWHEHYDDNWSRIGDIVPDTWYHVERIINPAEQTETIHLTNWDILQEFYLTHEIYTPIGSVEGFSLAAYYSPCYSLIDNLVVQTVPEPTSILLFGLGVLIIRKRRLSC